MIKKICKHCRQPMDPTNNMHHCKTAQRVIFGGNDRDWDIVSRPNYTIENAPIPTPSYEPTPSYDPPAIESGGGDSGGGGASGSFGSD